MDKEFNSHQNDQQFFLMGKDMSRQHTHTHTHTQLVTEDMKVCSASPPPK